jgi:hypothetical protein
MKLNATIRLLSCLTVCLLLVFALIGCNTSGSGEDTNDPSTDTTSRETDGLTEEITEAETEPQEVLLSIVTNKTLNYKIIYPEDGNAHDVTAANLFREYFSEVTKSSVRPESDFLKRGASHDPNTLEILVGHTNYDETAEVLSTLAYGDYAVRLVGNKIVVAGWEGGNTLDAATKLISIFKNAENGGEIAILSTDITFADTANELLSAAPIPTDFALSTIADCGYGIYQLVYSDVEKEAFTSYTNLLRTNNYEEYATHARGDETRNTTFATYVGNGYTYNVYYQNAYKELRVIIEPYKEGALPPKEQNYTKVCETTFAQVGLEYERGGELNQIGFCYIWRLEDGRFVIYDGGYEAHIVMSALETMAVDKKNIVIAAWIISHFHPDHDAAFRNFGSYASKVKLESVIYCPPSQAQFTAEGKGCYARYTTIANNLRVYGKDLVVYWAHPGQIYHFANAKFEIIYTFDMYTPQILTNNDLNTSSLVIEASFGSFNMMMTGDMSERSNTVICKSYGSALQADVVTVAHHGYAGGTTSFYALVNPTYVFWPTGERHYNECKSEGGRNEYFFRTNTNIEEVFVALDLVQIFCIENDVGFVTFKEHETIKGFIDGIVIDSWNPDDITPVEDTKAA